MNSYAHDTPSLAETYHRISESQFEGGKRLVEMLGVKTGDRVLDVGCGTGRLARWIAERVGPGGMVAGIDPLPERVAIARGGSRDIRFEIGSAEDLGCFADASFDVVCLNAVLHWIEDKPGALAELRRVLRPGGRLGGTTSPRELHWTAAVHSICASVLSRPPYLESLFPEALAVMDRNLTLTELVALLTERKFDLIGLHVVRREQVLQSGEEVADFAESSSFGNLTGLVPDHLRASLRSELAEAFEKIRRARGIALQGHAALFIAERKADPPGGG